MIPIFVFLSNNQIHENCVELFESSARLEKEVYGDIQINYFFPFIKFQID